MIYPSWILTKTSHPGNIGSAARAIKTMGFGDLILCSPSVVNPKQNPDAIALASGADDVLAKSEVFEGLKEACKPFQWVFGLSARYREFGPPAIPLEEAAKLAYQASLRGEKSAFLFGTERTGLENEDFESCTHRVWIDANPEYSSLNLAQAVMVCAYEARKAFLGNEGLVTIATELASTPGNKASREAVEAAMAHWQEGLEAIGYLDPLHPKKLMPRLRALFERAELQTEEIDLIRGIAKQMLIKK